MIYIDTVMPNPVHRVSAGKSLNDREQIDDVCRRDCINYLLSIFNCIYTQDLRYDHGSDIDKKKKKQTNKQTKTGGTCI